MSGDGELIVLIHKQLRALGGRYVWVRSVRGDQFEGDDVGDGGLDCGAVKSVSSDQTVLAE